MAAVVNDTLRPRAAAGFGPLRLDRIERLEGEQELIAVTKNEAEIPKGDDSRYGKLR